MYGITELCLSLRGLGAWGKACPPSVQAPTPNTASLDRLTGFQPIRINAHSIHSSPLLRRSILIISKWRIQIPGRHDVGQSQATASERNVDIFAQQSLIMSYNKVGVLFGQCFSYFKLTYFFCRQTYFESVEML